MTQLLGCSFELLTPHYFGELDIACEPNHRDLMLKINSLYFQVDGLEKKALTAILDGETLLTEEDLKKLEHINAKRDKKQEELTSLIKAYERKTK